MSAFPEKLVVDTNVPKIANRAINPETIPEDLMPCVCRCVEAVKHVVQHGGLVIDSGDEICSEYRKQLSLKGQPGVGDGFMKWVHDHGWGSSKVERVVITKDGESYDEFPRHAGLTDFDRSDRKFIAVANAHPEKPPVLQATDSKWWGWRDALKEVGLRVHFLCPAYIKAKYEQKMGE